MSAMLPYGLPLGIGPSILAADMSCLASECKLLEGILRENDYVHLDIMDGHFVPNLTFGAPVIKCLRKQTKLLLDAHLMVSEPEKWIDDIASAGVERFTFHIEASPDARAAVRKVKERGMKVGIALKPNTPVDAVLPLCDELDLVLIMTVEPGFGGQAFLPEQLEKVSMLRNLYPALNIEVDGGLNAETAKEAVRAGANFIVAGSYVFKGDKAAKIQSLRDAADVFSS